MNNLKIITATEARNKWFEVLNWVNTQRKEIWVRKNNKIVVRILPGNEPMIDNVEEVIARTRGMLAKKKTYFPYQDDKKVIFREKTYMKKIRLWKT